MNDRVSTLELFFDLVFVFTITQVARLVSGAHGTGDIGAAALILTIAWWMYGGYAWLTNNVGTRGVTLRLWMLVGTGAYLVMAMSIPRAATDDGLPFGVAYAIVTVVHAVLFTRATNSSARAIFRIAPYNFIAAAFVILAAFVDPRWRWTGWLAAVLMFVVSSLHRRESGFQVNPSHFAERHALVIIVAIGESVVSLGSGIDAAAVRWPLVRIVSLGFALCAAIWWTYFDGDDERGERALAAAPESGRARLALFAYSYSHLAMVGGIVGVAAGLHDAIAQSARAASYFATVRPTHAWILAGGAAMYLLSDRWFRRLLSLGPTRGRGVAALLALGTAPIGFRVSSGGQIAALVAVFVAMLVIETRGDRSRDRSGVRSGDRSRDRSGDRCGDRSGVRSGVRSGDRPRQPQSTVIGIQRRAGVASAED